MKNCLNVLKETIKRRLEYTLDNHSIKAPPEIKYLLYEEILRKCKNENSSLKQFDQFIAALMKYKSQDFRIELMKRFILNDEQVFSDEILESVLKIIKFLGIGILLGNNYIYR